MSDRTSPRRTARWTVGGFIGVLLIAVPSAWLPQAFGSEVMSLERRDGVTARVWDTGGVGLKVRTEPNTDADVVRTLHTGDTVTISCQVEGPTVYNDVNDVRSNLWDYLPAYQGYVADAWIYTGTNGRIDGLGDCEDAGDDRGSDRRSEPGEPAADKPAADEPESTGSAGEASGSDLAARWAPVHYQDTDATNHDGDYLSRVDFDGDWDTSNNWERQDDYLLTGAVYYSVVSTDTHHFILYAYYHPRDWCQGWFCDHKFAHENDMEGVLLAIRRDGSRHGTLEAMVTVSHKDFYSYAAPHSPYTDGHEDVDGEVREQVYGGYNRPTTWQEARGHGCKAWGGDEFAGGDGVVYYPVGTGEVPSDGDDRFVPYQLVDIFASGGLWAHRSDPATFSGDGQFNGDNGDGNANAPWGWKDQDQDGDMKGAIAKDPARLVWEYFGGLGKFSRTYTSNPYQG